MTNKEKAAIMERVAILNEKREAYAINVLLSNGLAGQGHKALNDKLNDDRTYNGLCNKWLIAYEMAEMLLGDMTNETLPRYQLTVNGLCLTAIKYRLYTGKVSPEDFPSIDWRKLWTWAIDYNYDWPEWGEVEKV